MHATYYLPHIPYATLGNLNGRIPVTLQVGLVGAEGVVLASDRRALTVWARTGGVASSSVSKILKNKQGKFAYCFWGDMLAAHGARLVQEELEKTPASESGLKSCIDQALRQRRKIVKAADLPDLLGGGIILVTITDGKPELWKLDVLKQTDSVQRVARVEGKIVAGDAANQANFFLERYFRADAPIKEHLALAAHTILMAGHLNPTCVAGLDLLACTSEGFRAIVDSELNSLLRKSETLDHDIRTAFQS